MEKGGVRVLRAAENNCLKKEYDKVSQLVLLESYTKKESFAGVFTVSLKVTEYVAAGIRSTDIPYLPRPGKNPTPPPAQIPAGKTAYDVAKQTYGVVDAAKAIADAAKGVGNWANGKIVNTMDPNYEADMLRSNMMIEDRWKYGIKSAAASMSKAFSTFDQKFKK